MSPHSREPKEKNDSFAASARSLTAFEKKWHQWTLPNGLQCIYMPLPEGDLRFHVTALLGTGSRGEPKNLSGISHLLEHMMFRGSSKYPTYHEQSEAFEGLGGEWNAATGHEYTEFYYSGVHTNLSESLELFADFLIKPCLTELETERRIVKRELEGELNENGVSTDPDFHIATKVWPGLSIAQPIVGTTETLDKINRDDLKGWFKHHYTPNNCVLCLVGGNKKDVLKSVQDYFSGWAPTKNLNSHENLRSNFSGPYAFLIPNSDNEYQLQLSFLCEGTGHPQTPVYEMISRILSDGFSSRMTKRIREELGLVYDISAALHQYYGMGLFNISATVLGENLELVLEEIFKILDSLKTKNVLPSELRRHQQRAKVDIEMAMADPSTLAWRSAWSLLTQTELRLSDWFGSLIHVTPDEIRTTSNLIFTPAHLCSVVIGPDEQDVEKKFIKFISKWKNQ